MPRAGINIGDGCWGGHVIEFCDVFDTVKETGDHGSFNSWGRDRYWGLKGIDLDAITAGKDRDLPMLDAVEPIMLRNNRWRCDHGWDIDLDDGSSNYHIYNNLCLHGGIKNREGFYRTVENNIMVNNSFHPHVWFHGSGDVFRRNIVFATFKPIEMKPPWGKECDFNLLHVAGWHSPIPAKDRWRRAAGTPIRSSATRCSATAFGVRGRLAGPAAGVQELPDGPVRRAEAGARRPSRERPSCRGRPKPARAAGCRERDGSVVAVKSGGDPPPPTFVAPALERKTMEMPALGAV